MQKIEVLGKMNLNGNFDIRSRVYSINGLCPTIDTMTGGGREPMILESQVIGGLGEKKSNNGTQFYQQDRVYTIGEIAPCIPAQIPGGSYNFLEKKDIKTDKITEFNNFIYKINDEWVLIRIRKLTPKECWRLMGFYDEDYKKAEKVSSKTQLYKQAGNSIVVNVLEEIFKQMIGE